MGVAPKEWGWRGHLAFLASPAAQGFRAGLGVAASRDRDDVALTRSWPGRCGIVPVMAPPPPGPALAAGNSLRKNHTDVTSSWSDAPRCDIVVVCRRVPGRLGG